MKAAGWGACAGAEFGRRKLAGWLGGGVMEDKERHLLIDAICGVGVGRSYEFADRMMKAGLAEFCGNQWNEAWAWKRGALDGLTAEQLRALYEDAKK